jgi:hypothetical protein
VLADQISITSQSMNILGSAYSIVQVAAPYSNSFYSSAFHAWNLNFVSTGSVWVMGSMDRATTTILHTKPARTIWKKKKRNLTQAIYNNLNLKCHLHKTRAIDEKWELIHVCSHTASTKYNVLDSNLESSGKCSMTVCNRTWMSLENVTKVNFVIHTVHILIIISSICWLILWFLTLRILEIQYSICSAIL